MSDNRSSVRDLLDLMELEEFKKLREEREKAKSKPPEKWWNVNPVKLGLILIVLWPIIGSLYLKLIMALWK